MLKLTTFAFLLGCAVSSVLGHPVQNAFASVETSNEYPHSGAAHFVEASLLSLPDFAAGHFYVASTTSATFQLAAKEFDPPLSQIVSVYDHSQNKANDFLNVRIL